MDYIEVNFVPLKCYSIYGLDPKNEMLNFSPCNIACSGQIKYEVREKYSANMLIKLKIRNEQKFNLNFHVKYITETFRKFCGKFCL